MSRPAEATRIHTQLLRCTLEVDGARAWWQHVDRPRSTPPIQQAFADYWFGAKSLARTEVLVANFRARFDAYPEALDVLHRWRDMDPAVRILVCHWHLQLSDPLYRAFTGSFLVERRESHPEVTHGLVVSWVAEQATGRWSLTTCIQFASKLLSSARSAGLVQGTRDPRSLVTPRVPDEALAYLMYLLRGVDFAGTLVDNPYTASVGLDRALLEERLRGLPALDFRRQGEILDFGWAYPSLLGWASTVVEAPA